MPRGRSAAVYSRRYTEGVREKLEKVVKAFPNKFQDINTSLIDIVFKETPKSTFRAQIKLVKGLFSAYSDKELTLIIHKGDWNTSDEYQKAFVLYEQLIRVFYDDDKREYRLKRYEIETFEEILQDFGLKYEKTKEIFSKALQS